MADKIDVFKKVLTVGTNVHTLFNDKYSYATVNGVRIMYGIAIVDLCSVNGDTYSIDVDLVNFFGGYNDSDLFAHCKRGDEEGHIFWLNGSSDDPSILLSRILRDYIQVLMSNIDCEKMLETSEGIVLNCYDFRGLSDKVYRVWSKEGELFIQELKITSIDFEIGDMDCSLVCCDDDTKFELGCYGRYITPSKDMAEKVLDLIKDFISYTGVSVGKMLFFKDEFYCPWRERHALCYAEVC